FEVLEQVVAGDEGIRIRPAAGPRLAAAQMAGAADRNDFLVGVRSRARQQRGALLRRVILRHVAMARKAVEPDAGELAGLRIHGSRMTTHTLLLEDILLPRRAGERA